MQHTRITWNIFFQVQISEACSRSTESESLDTVHSHIFLPKASPVLLMTVVRRLETTDLAQSAQSNDEKTETETVETADWGDLLCSLVRVSAWRQRSRIWSLM